LEYSCVLHDGTGVVESESYTFDFTVYEDEKKAAKEVQRFGEELLALMRKIQTNKGMNVSNPFFAIKVEAVLTVDPFGSRC